MQTGYSIKLRWQDKRTAIVRLSLLLLCFILNRGGAGFAFAQNLVPNASFEIYTYCPVSEEIDNVPPWTIPPNNISDPVYYNACETTNTFGSPYNGLCFQQPLSGVGYVGFLPHRNDLNNAREYIYCPLYCPLEQGVSYKAGFFVNKVDIAYAIDKIGMYIGDCLLYTSDAADE